MIILNVLKIVPNLKRNSQKSVLIFTKKGFTGPRCKQVVSVLQKSFFSVLWSWVWAIRENTEVIVTYDDCYEI